MVDHTLLCYLIAKYRKSPGDSFSVCYAQTQENQPASKLFEGFGFELSHEEGNVKILTYPHALPNPTNDIVRITEKGSPA
jgi:predicted enzyme involved in methoxymalonyl-ACP biosynthesis